MNGRRAKILKAQVSALLSEIPPWKLEQMGTKTGFYGRTFVRGGMHRAYKNAKRIWTRYKRAPTLEAA